MSPDSSTPRRRQPLQIVLDVLAIFTITTWVVAGFVLMLQPAGKLAQWLALVCVGGLAATVVVTIIDYRRRQRTAAGPDTGHEQRSGPAAAGEPRS